MIFQRAIGERLYSHRSYLIGDEPTQPIRTSTIKTICLRRKGAIPPNGASKDFIKVIFDNELSARSRNKSTAGHGQRPAVVVVPPQVATFALHVAASTIVLLVEADEVKR